MKFLSALHILQIPECISTPVTWPAQIRCTENEKVSGHRKVCIQTVVRSQTETGSRVFIRRDIAVCSELPVHLRNVQMSRMTSVRSWKSPFTVLILLHQRVFFEIAQHQTKERLLSDIMLQENPKNQNKWTDQWLWCITRWLALWSEGRGTETRRLKAV